MDQTKDDLTPTLHKIWVQNGIEWVSKADAWETCLSIERRCLNVVIGMPAKKQVNHERASILKALLITCLIMAVGFSKLAYAQEKDRGKVGPFLLKLVEAYEKGGVEPAKKLAVLHGLKGRSVDEDWFLPVILEPSRSRTATRIDRARLKRLGVRVDAVSKSFMRVLAPFRLVKRLGDFPDIRRVRRPIPKKALDVGFGTIVSESVGLTGAEAMHGAGFVGIGVKVAVVDLGFMGLTDAIAAGELPMDAHRVKGNLDDEPVEVLTEHGTAVAEHVMDMAPGAELYCILVEDEVDFENAADYIRDHGIQVANHSVGWVNASYYDDTGPLTTIVNDSRDFDDVFWAVSAGNDARRHWRGGWDDPEGNDLLNFSGSDETMELTTSSSVAYIFLNWDQYGNSVTDLNLYIRNKNGLIVAASETVQTGSQAPAEAVGFYYLSFWAPYSIEVRRRNGPTAGLDMTLFSFYNDLEHAVAGSSLMEPAEAHGAFSAGAIYFGNWEDTDPPIRSYSSQGPTNDGRLKPDIAAPDGTTSWTYGQSNGTSFSSPTAAGAAAVMRQVAPSLSAQDLAGTMAALAIDIGAPGPDNVFGAGKLLISLEVCISDFDHDGVVSETDLAAFAGSFGRVGCAGDCDGDFDGDGDVDGWDLYEMAAGFGSTDCPVFSQ